MRSVARHQGDADSHWEASPHPRPSGHRPKTRSDECRRGRGGREPWSTANGDADGAAAAQSSVGVLEKLKTGPPYGPAAPVLGTRLGGPETPPEGTPAPALTAALLMTARPRRRPKCPLTGEGWSSCGTYAGTRVSIYVCTHSGASPTPFKKWRSCR